MPQYRTFVPKNVDLSNKELKIRVEDELKNLLKAIRASVDVYPEDEPQYLHEMTMFISDKLQEVSLEEYPNIQKLFKSFIADDILQGGGRQPYEPKQIEQFLEGTKQFYRESTDLTTEGYFDVNIISELGFRSSPDKLKNFLKDVGVVGQTGLSRGLREVFRYFTGTFQDTGLTPISATYEGRNPELYNTLESLPFLESVGEGRFIVKLLTKPEDTKTIFADATDLVPVYEKFRSLKPARDRTLPEQMQHLKAMQGEVKLPSQQGQDLLRYLVYEYSAKQDKDRQERLGENSVDVGAIRRRFFHIKNPHARRAAIENAIQDAKQNKDSQERLGENSEVAKRIEEKRKRNRSITFHPDQAEEIPEEELKRIPVPIKPKKAGKPSATSPLAEKLRQRAEARLKAADQKAAKRLGIQPDDTKKPEKIPTKKPPIGGAGVLLGVMPILKWARDYYAPGPKGIKRGGIIKSNQISLKDQMTKLTG